MEIIWNLILAHLPEVMPALVLAAILGYVGTKTVPMVRKQVDSKWKSIFLDTAWAHPVLTGAVFGLSPYLPVPGFMGSSWEASVLWYALAGVISLPVYKKLMKRLEKA